ncbi:acyl- N-acyltransferase (NAT) superfamily [Olea europaea subsp. europaea]|uniref:Acyl- N-acyltransferase (NAT) superfamily, partial n=1 Tax=Olea europaea subsp. europaea TaxID=158383 RepID=A0A8S0PLK2_OLEEU|nr:acyl- N-acyltransferase (NAT) superfamily [Olea europaea subsp. europaea]
MLILAGIVLKNNQLIKMSSFPLGLCRASQVAELFLTVSPEIVVREARLEHCWEVAETHCSSFFSEYSFPLDFVLRINRLIGMLFGFSMSNGSKRTRLVAVIGSSGHKLHIYQMFRSEKDVVGRG